MIHQTACVDAGAEIGPGTSIWHFSHIRTGAKIGARCNLGQNVYVDPDVVIGNGVKIQNNVSIYRGVTIDDDVFLGPSCVFTNVGRPRSAFPTDEAQYALTRVGRGATIGANATIVCGVTIGEHAFVAAGAVVTKDVPSHALVMGVPGRAVGWVCVCGLALRPPGSAAKAYVRCTCGRRFELSSSRAIQLEA